MKEGDGHQCLSLVEFHHFLATHPFLPGRACKVRGPSIPQQTAKLTQIIHYINYLKYTLLWWSLTSCRTELCQCSLGGGHWPASPPTVAPPPACAIGPGSLMTPLTGMQTEQSCRPQLFQCWMICREEAQWGSAGDSGAGGWLAVCVHHSCTYSRSTVSQCRIANQ